MRPFLSCLSHILLFYWVLERQTDSIVLRVHHPTSSNYRSMSEAKCPFLGTWVKVPYRQVTSIKPWEQLRGSHQGKFIWASHVWVFALISIQLGFFSSQPGFLPTLSFGFLTLYRRVWELYCIWIPFIDPSGICSQSLLPDYGFNMTSYTAICTMTQHIPDSLCSQLWGLIEVNMTKADLRMKSV